VEEGEEVEDGPKTSPSTTTSISISTSAMTTNGDSNASSAASVDSDAIGQATTAATTSHPAPAAALSSGSVPSSSSTLPTPPSSSAPAVPPGAPSFRRLRRKYGPELDYMLILEGCASEAMGGGEREEGDDVYDVDDDFDRQRRAESARKLEEHIIANLLPVKHRLTRQLAAQRGASRDPVTAPVRGATTGAPSSASSPARSTEGGGVGNMTTTTTGVSFAETAEAKRKAAYERIGSSSSYPPPPPLTGMVADPTAMTPVTTTTKSTEAEAERAGGGGGGGGVGGDAIRRSSPPPSRPQPQPQRRAILYAGMAPGSTQVPSSICAASGAHPGLIDERTAHVVRVAEDERAQLRRLEECATRAALGIDVMTTTTTTTTTASTRTSVDNRSAAAKALAMAGGESSGGEPRPNRESSSSSSSVAPDAAVPSNHQQVKWPPTATADADVDAAIVVQINPNSTKSPHVPLNFDDPTLTPPQQFELRLREARWRQRKRRRARRRQRNGLATTLQQVNALAHCKNNQNLLANDNGISRITVGDGHAANSGGVLGGDADAPGGGVGLEVGCGVGAAEAYNPPAPPRRQAIEYVCAICNEVYPSTCELNPWWALTNHECPKCGKMQIPRLDITAAVNALEYHPALVANMEDNGGVSNNAKLVDDAMFSQSSSVAESSYHQPGGVGSAAQTTTATATTMDYHHVMHHETTTPIVRDGVTYITRGPTNAAAAAAAAAAAGMAREASSFSDCSDVSHTDESDGVGGSGGGANGGYNYDESSDDDDDEIPLAGGGGSDDEEVDSTIMEELVEREEFGYEYKGETLSEDQARRLLVLIEHASTCPGRHLSAEHRNVCHSTKYLMLHVRDCSGLLSNGDICPFPWCRKVKHLLYHLVSCEGVGQCTICCPPEDKLSPNLNALVGLNSHRRDKFRERVKTVLAKRHQLVAAAAAARAEPSSAKVKTTTVNPAHITTNNATFAASHVAKPQTATVTTTDQPLLRLSPAMQSHAPHHSQQGGMSPASMSTAPNTISASVASSQSSTTSSSTAIAATTFLASHPQRHLPSPALSSTLARFDSSMSISALPTLEEATYELGDIALSTSDLMGLSSSSSNDLAATALSATFKTEATATADLSAL
ncbi:hypothetical protein ACHAXA_007831, partial [Cyclostephanos tholiformis]